MNKTYKYFWHDLTWVGKIVLFPVVVSLYILCLFVKEQEDEPRNEV